MNALDPVQQYAGWKRRELFHECVRLRNAELRRAKNGAAIPSEPTDRMIAAGRQAVAEFADCGSFETLAIQAYKAMVYEAPNLQDEDSNE